MEPKLRIAAITDEYAPDPAVALDAMAKTGMTGAELRMLWGKNIVNLTDDEVARAMDLVRRHGMEVMSLASPLLKCVLPGGGDPDSRFQQDVFASTATMDDQPRLADRAFKLTEITGAKIIRVFSYWRTVTPERCFDAIAKALTQLGDQAKQHGVVIGLENEHACNIGTCAESAKMLAAVNHPNVKLIWDPANGLVGGEEPYPYGYKLLPASQIVHVHAKDCHMDGHKPIWGPLGTRHVDWKGIVDSLLKDGYRGWVSLETHWPGPQNEKFQASWICGWNLRGLLAA